MERKQFILAGALAGTAFLNGLWAVRGHAEQPSATKQDAGEAMVHQLRIYEIFEDNKAAFHARFRDHVTRIMKSYGFHIVTMWEARDDGRTEFVYLLQWPDEATMTDRWARFMADREWAEIKEKTTAEHGSLVGGIQSRVLRLTEYSARPQ